jgi:hypothetical protein
MATRDDEQFEYLMKAIAEGKAVVDAGFAPMNVQFDRIEASSIASTNRNCVRFFCRRR